MDGDRADFDDGESEGGVERRLPRRLLDDANSRTWSGDAEQRKLCFKISSKLLYNTR